MKLAEKSGKLWRTQSDTIQCLINENEEVIF